MNLTITDLPKTETEQVKISHNQRELKNVKTCQFTEIALMFWQ